MKLNFRLGIFVWGPIGSTHNQQRQFFSPLEPTRNPGTRSFATNNNGSILYSLENLFTQAGQNLGYIRFRTRVNGTQP